VRSRLLPCAALALAAACLAAAPAAAGRQRLFHGPAALRGFSYQSVQFAVPGDWMRAPRLTGRLEISGAGRRDIEVLVLREADLAAWEKRHPVTPVHAPARASAFDLALPLPGPGAYVLVLSNRFSKLTTKHVAGDVVLTWDDDPSLPAGAALRATVRFAADAAGPGATTLALSDADASARAHIAAPGADGARVVEIVRPAARGGASFTASYAGAFEAAGAADVHGDGDLDLFLVGTSRDSAGAWRDLLLLCPRQRATVSLSLGAGPSGAPPVVRFGAGYAAARFAAEQSFLERIRSAYAAP